MYAQVTPTDNDVPVRSEGSLCTLRCTSSGRGLSTRPLRTRSDLSLCALDPSILAAAFSPLSLFEDQFCRNRRQQRERAHCITCDWHVHQHTHHECSVSLSLSLSETHTHTHTHTHTPLRVSCHRRQRRSMFEQLDAAWRWVSHDTLHAPATCSRRTAHARIRRIRHVDGQNGSVFHFPQPMFHTKDKLSSTVHNIDN